MREQEGESGRCSPTPLPGGRVPASAVSVALAIQAAPAVIELDASSARVIGRLLAAHEGPRLTYCTSAGRDVKHSTRRTVRRSLATD